MIYDITSRLYRSFVWLNLLALPPPELKLPKSQSPPSSRTALTPSMLSCQSGSLLEDILFWRREDLLMYLESKDQGSKASLVREIKRMEQHYGGQNPGHFMHLMHNHYNSCKNPLFELPTNELCMALLKLFQHFGITRVLELGAANALLSARLQLLIRRQNSDIEVVPITPITPPDIPEYTSVYGDFGFHYTKTYDGTFSTQHEPQTPILISWINLSTNWMEYAFSEMVLRNHPTHVFLIGEAPLHTQDVKGSSVTVTQPSTQSIVKCMTQFFAYDVFCIPAKQVSSSDYFANDSIRTPNDSRTCITMFVKRDAHLTEAKAMANMFINVCKSVIIEQVKLIHKAIHGPSPHTSSANATRGNILGGKDDTPSLPEFGGTVLEAYRKYDWKDICGSENLGTCRSADPAIHYRYLYQDSEQTVLDPFTPVDVRKAEIEKQSRILEDANENGFDTSRPNGLKDYIEGFFLFPIISDDGGGGI